MNLEVRLLVRPDGTAAFVLTDADGVMLPMQLGLDLFQVDDEATEIEVRLAVDGERVRLTNALASAWPVVASVAPGDGGPAECGATVLTLRPGRKPH